MVDLGLSDLFFNSLYSERAWDQGGGKVPVLDEVKLREGAQDFLLCFSAMGLYITTDVDELIADYKGRL